MVPLGCGGGGGSSSNGGGGGQTTGGGGTGGSTGGTGGATCTPSSEVCDGMDNNCDGKVDEGCACKQGDTQLCYPGDPATKDIGACKSGSQTCDVNGAWGDCIGAVTPANEKCDALDNDCNGAADDLPNLKCGVGACNVEVPACANGAPNTCVPGMPTVEVCDGIDNNCNQLVDETFAEQGMACDSGQLGACQAGTMQCLTNMGVTAPTCVAKLMPGSEMCDGVDNDCNGAVDDNIPGTGTDCVTGEQGVCGPGTIQCQNGTVDCFSNVVASNEKCDGLDNDCNGAVDDLPGAGMACSTGLLGVCASGINGCVNGTLQCVQQVQAAATDTCGDNLDNNCNGTVDEGCLNQFSGVATNVPIASLTGWTQCYLDNYGSSGALLSTIQTQCNKAKLLLGCRLTGSSTLNVAAWAPRADVLFDTGTTQTPHNANGVGWYYSGSYSWGFAPQGSVINRNSCDIVDSQTYPGGGAVDGDKRICWHTSANALSTGWRCGKPDFLGATYERIVFHAN